MLIPTVVGRQRKAASLGALGFFIFAAGGVDAVFAAGRTRAPVAAQSWRSFATSAYPPARQNPHQITMPHQIDAFIRVMERSGLNAQDMAAPGITVRRQVELVREATENCAENLIGQTSPEDVADRASLVTVTTAIDQARVVWDDKNDTSDMHIPVYAGAPTWRRQPLLKAASLARRVMKHKEPPDVVSARRRSFAAIIPKVSKDELSAAIQGTPIGTRKKRLLGYGSESRSGVFAVAEMTRQGPIFYVLKYCDDKETLDAFVHGIQLVKKLKEQGVVVGFDVVDVLAETPNALELRLSLTEGRDVKSLTMEKGDRGGYEDVLARYSQALEATAVALEKAGWEIKRTEGGFWVDPKEPGDDPFNKIYAFRIFPNNVVATPDGRLILIDLH